MPKFPLPANFYSVEEQVSPILPKKVMNPFALVVYIAAIASFALFYRHYEAQTLAIEETEIVTTLDGYSAADGWTCVILQSQGGALEGLDGATDLTNIFIPICGMIAIDADSTSISYYSNVYFPKAADCDMHNRSNWQRLYTTDSTYEYRSWAYNTSAGVFTTKKVKTQINALVNPTPATCSNDAVYEEIYDYFVNGTIDLCFPFQDLSPYQCSRTVEEPLNDLLGTWSLAFAATEFVFLAVCTLLVFMFNAWKGKDEKEEDEDGGGCCATLIEEIFAFFCCGETQADEENEGNGVDGALDVQLKRQKAKIQSLEKQVKFLMGKQSPNSTNELKNASGSLQNIENRTSVEMKSMVKRRKNSSYASVSPLVGTSDNA